MDLHTLENTSSYAIEASYNHFWSLIPNKYKLPEDDRMIKDLSPFYDPELTFDNRLHYKLTNIDYPKRSEPWFVITWNPEYGLIRSTLTQRRFQTAVFDTRYGKKRGKVIRAELTVNFGIVCNTMQGLFELQENFILKERDKIVCHTKPHSILGSFPVCLDVIDTTQSKLPRDRGTICYLFVNCRMDYPVIGLVEDAVGVIEQIHSDIDGAVDIENFDIDVGTNLVKDVIVEDTPIIFD